MVNNQGQQSCRSCLQIVKLIEAVEQQKGWPSLDNVPLPMRLKSLVESILDQEAQLISDKKAIIKESGENLKKQGWLQFELEQLNNTHSEIIEKLKESEKAFNKSNGQIASLQRNISDLEETIKELEGDNRLLKQSNIEQKEMISEMNLGMSKKNNDELVNQFAMMISKISPNQEQKDEISRHSRVGRKSIIKLQQMGLNTGDSTDLMSTASSNLQDELQKATLIHNQEQNDGNPTIIAQDVEEPEPEPEVILKPVIVAHAGATFDSIKVFKVQRQISIAHQSSSSYSILFSKVQKAKTVSGFFARKDFQITYPSIEVPTVKGVEVSQDTAIVYRSCKMPSIQPEECYQSVTKIYRAVKIAIVNSFSLERDRFQISKKFTIPPDNSTKETLLEIGQKFKKRKVVKKRSKQQSPSSILNSIYH